LGIGNVGFLLISGECAKKGLMQAANQQIVERFYEGLVDRDERVLVLHTSDVPSALEQFGRLARRSGLSIYKWSKVSGLQSLKDSDISVPGSNELPDMLRYVLSSKHFGVYIVTDFGFQFGRRCEDFLLQIRRTEFGDARKVILVGENPKIPPWVSGHLVHVVENEPGEFRLRLRNGRWVA
jgi:hypothetical protein